MNDYDNDGWLDIYLPNGSTFPALKGEEPAPRAMLFHNHHDGIFTDVTDQARVANERWGFLTRDSLIRFLRKCAKVRALETGRAVQDRFIHWGSGSRRRLTTN
jgi:hypothetical protein